MWRWIKIVVMSLFAGIFNCLRFWKVLEKNMFYTKEGRVDQEKVVAIDTIVKADSRIACRSHAAPLRV
jgi:hypothetical protein